MLLVWQSLSPWRKQGWRPCCVLSLFLMLMALALVVHVAAEEDVIVSASSILLQSEEKENDDNDDHHVHHHHHHNERRQQQQEQRNEQVVDISWNGKILRTNNGNSVIGSFTNNVRSNDQQQKQQQRYDLLILICTQSFTGEELVEDVLVDLLATIPTSATTTTSTTHIALVDEAVDLNGNALDWSTNNAQADQQPWTLADKTQTLLVIASTYGDGDAPNHATEFANWIEQQAQQQHQQDSKVLLEDEETNVFYYSVFGLGDSSYPHFCAFGKFIDHHLQQIKGAVELVPYHTGDVFQGNNVRQAFTIWANQVVHALSSKTTITTTKEDGEQLLSEQQQDLKLQQQQDVANALFDSTGTDWRRSALDPASITAYLEQVKPLLSSSSSSSSSSLLEKDGEDRSVLHVSLSLPVTTITLQPGDYLGIYPRNTNHVVQRTMEWLFLHNQSYTKISVKTMKHWQPNNQQQRQQQRFHRNKNNLWKATKISAREFLQQHVDLMGKATPSTLRALLPFVGTLQLRALARDLTVVETMTTTDTNTTSSDNHHRDRHASRWDIWISQQDEFPYLTKLDLAIKFQCRPSLQALARALGPIQPRLYSIATVHQDYPAAQYSQPELDGLCGGQTVVSLCMAVAHRGLTTYYYLSQLPVGSPVTVYTRVNPEFHYNPAPESESSSSSMMMMHQSPTYWIAAGSGIGPYIGFLQQEMARQKNQDEVDDDADDYAVVVANNNTDNNTGRPLLLLSHVHLLLGYRTPSDVLYADELATAQREPWGVDVRFAFSRVFGQPRTYVPQLLVQNEEFSRQVYQDLFQPQQQRGRIYVCGRLELCQSVETILTQLVLKYNNDTLTSSSPAAAHALVQQLQKEGRFLTDCWSIADNPVSLPLPPMNESLQHQTVKPVIVTRLARHHGHAGSTTTTTTATDTLAQAQVQPRQSTPNDDLAVHVDDYYIENIPAWPSYLRMLATGELERRIQNATAMHSACVACGRFCEVNRLSPNRSDWGECRVGERAIVYAHDAHFGEEDCLKGTHGSGTIFFGACNLKCIYCQNWKLSFMDQGEIVTPERMADMMLALQNRGCHNINFVSPTHNVLAILQGILVAAQRGLRLPLVWNTGGYDSVASLRLLEGIFDIYMPDAKYASRKVARKLSRIDNYPEINQAAIKEMHRQVGPLQIDPRTGLAFRGVLVRHLVLPQDYAGTMDVASFLVNEVSADSYVHVMDYYRPEHEAANDRKYGLNRKPTRRELQQAHRRARGACLHRIHAEDPNQYPPLGTSDCHICSQDPYTGEMTCGTSG